MLWLILLLTKLSVSGTLIPTPALHRAKQSKPSLDGASLGHLI